MVGKILTGSDSTTADAPAGKYLIQVCAQDGSICDASNTSFTITEPVSNTLRVTSPNGGESWQRGTIKTISWVKSGITASTQLLLVPDMSCTVYGTCPPNYSFAKRKIATDISASSYTWSVGKVLSGETIPAGKYTIQACTSDGSICDASDNFFTIVNP